MRDIKFRAWDGIAGVMWYDVHFDPTHIYLSEWDNDKQDWKAQMPRWDTNPIMQYTGFHDKNGKEIYEGDILSHEGDVLKCVEWESNDLGHDGGLFVGFSLGWAHLISECEVIGNKFERQGDV